MEKLCPRCLIDQGQQGQYELTKLPKNIICGDLLYSVWGNLRCPVCDSTYFEVRDNEESNEAHN